MSVQAQSADGVIHDFPDGTDPAVIGKVMKAYAAQNTKTSAPGFKFSDDSIKNAAGRPGTALVYMKPDQYLAMTPDLPDNARTDRKGKSLQNSLNKGDDVNEVPSLEVVTDKDGNARVTDQDGRHRALFAKQSGVDLIPVAVQQFGKTAPIKNLTGMRDGSAPVPFDFSPVPQAKPVAPKPQQPTVGQGIKTAFTDIPKEISKESTANLQAFKDSVTRPIGGEVLGSKTLGGVVDYMKRPFEVAGNAMGYLASPVTGAATSMVGRPLEIATQGAIPREVTGNVVSALIPVGGEAEAAGVAQKTANATRAAARGGETAQGANAARSMGGAAKTGEDAAHAAKVNRLKADGVEPTLGQTIGGQARRYEESAKSNPLVGPAVRAQEQKATDTLNRAIYKKVLAPINQTVDASVPVGREGVKAVNDKLDTAYEELKPKMRLAPDEELSKGMKSVREQVTEIPPSEQQQFEAIMKNRVIPRLEQSGGVVDGETFKRIESDLTTSARNNRSAGRFELADAIDDVNGLLRDNLERSSDPGIRDRLKAVNTGWAMFTRVRDAAARRAGGGGVISPGDLINSVKKMDKSRGKGAFARGDALLQRFAEDAYDVLGSKVPDSGTPERLMSQGRGMVGGAIGAAIGGLPGAAVGAAIDRALPHVTNPLSYRAMNAAKSMTAPHLRNFLLSEKLKTSPFVHHPAALNSVLQLSNQAQSQ